MKICIVICFACALVAVGQCQDLTTFMFQAMGIEPPVLPPVMPQALREHLYPRQRRQQFLEQQRLQQQKQRYLAYLASQQERQVKANPYSMPSYASSNQPRDNSVYSSANKIRYPGSANSVGFSKGNPYSSSYQSSSSKGNTVSTNGNPYSMSRAGSSGIASIRNSARSSMAPVPIPAHATRLMRTMQTLRAVRDHPRKVTDAQSIGCSMPGDSANILMYATCRDPAAVMVCQVEMMTCMNVGMSSMCCPFGVNNLALDTVGYVNRLQHFVSEFA